MVIVRKNLIDTAISKAYALIDFNVHDDIHKQNEFQKQIILADESLTEDEKSEAMRILTVTYDENKILFNEGTRRVCENCNQECLATTYCEHCIRNYLKTNFSNWTSENDVIDILIQEYQMQTFVPDNIIEWIPYDNFKKIKYLTEGGCSEIYTATWIDGHFIEWDSKDQQLKRFGKQGVILKRLENVKSSNKSWFDEARSHLYISNKWPDVVIQCYGLTCDPLNNSYMLVMNLMDTDLRKYLQKNHNKLTWKERIQITLDIIDALFRIHNENMIHRDLHSGNILSRIGGKFIISDLGFCGPTNKPLKSVYGNLPYIAPEVIAGNETTFKSDIYSVAMLMWEISSGKPPFFNYEYDYDLIMNIINGIRPKIVPGTPLKYKNLMTQCWDANPLNRPNIKTLQNKIRELNLYYQNHPNKLNQLKENDSFENDSSERYTNSWLFTSKIFRFENLPEPRNATKEEQAAFHSNRSYNFYIPNNVNGFDKVNNRMNNLTKRSGNVRASNKCSLKISKENSINDIREIMQPLKKYHTINDYNDEICDSPNLHSEEQDKLELPNSLDK
ncbi:hypothetical protein RclHR1_00010003 [Rhizophagus clarus]|uniref:Kinase-like domain-containing protein n=1 Tax=Rhizophagus clarus TaxID=94130 RepID=A0A2Z6QED2_9GLOM|nr:hypothetical protein RclHR1_00010003 [Rhizophagus clarus]GES75207.1 kinase-like domain-containing protein [Rhizophagus clarus]